MDQIVGEKEHAKIGEFPHSFFFLCYIQGPTFPSSHNFSSLVLYIPSPHSLSDIGSTCGLREELENGNPVTQTRTVTSSCGSVRLNLYNLALGGFCTLLL